MISKENKNFKVQYVDIMEKNKIMREDNFNNIFQIALEMNNMGYYEGYEIEYIVRNMINSYSSSIKAIEDSYKLELIESWDFEVKDIYEETNSTVDISVLEYLRKIKKDRNEYTEEEIQNLRDFYIKKIYDLFREKITALDESNAEELCVNILKDLDGIKTTLFDESQINEDFIEKYNNVMANILENIPDDGEDKELKISLLVLQMLIINPYSIYAIKQEYMEFIKK